MRMMHAMMIHGERGDDDEDPLCLAATTAAVAVAVATTPATTPTTPTTTTLTATGLPDRTSVQGTTTRVKVVCNDNQDSLIWKRAEER